MALAILDQADVIRLVGFFMQTNDKHEAYKLYNPNWRKLRKKTVSNHVSNLFKQPLVIMEIKQRNERVLGSVMDDRAFSISICMEQLEEVRVGGMRTNNLTAALGAIKEKARLMGLYNGAQKAPIKMERIMERPGKVVPIKPKDQ